MNNLPVETSCPVCGRTVLLHEDGTLWNHFTSFMNQDDPSQPLCIGSEMKVAPPLEILFAELTGGND